MTDYGREAALTGARLRLAGEAERAPRGEHAAAHWLFVLTMPAVSDHQWWAIVPRQNQPIATPYSYGFN